MHIHILGICGTFMGGLAALAREAGHTVTGCDAGVYPPMSDQLRALGIELIEGFAAEQIALLPSQPEMYVVGNVVSRARLPNGEPKFPLMEAIMQQGLPYTSGPQWLAEHVLQGRHVLAVAGTHGKTTTTAMLTWILECAGLNPGFLVGGVPLNFGVSARLGRLNDDQAAAPGRPKQGTAPSGGSEPHAVGSVGATAAAAPGRPKQGIAPSGGNEPHKVGSVGAKFFVIEADEYDTAFFDKRSKFVHYRPRTAVLNNLEFDHADIFDDLGQIERQFHHLVRTVPCDGRVVVNGLEESLQRVLNVGCWSEVRSFGAAVSDFTAQGDASDFEVHVKGQHAGNVKWALTGTHNQLNALAAIAAADHVGLPVHLACQALETFQNVKRRMEIRAVIGGTGGNGLQAITLYDDFAHHPTAIRTTVDGLRRSLAPGQRILAVFEPRSNTMKLGAMKSQLPWSLEAADLAFCHTGGLGWDAAQALQTMGSRAQTADSIDALVAQVMAVVQPGDHIVCMSNGSFGGIHARLIALLAAKAEASN